MTTSRWQRADFLAWGALALAAILVHAAELDGRVPFHRDISHASLPFHRYLGEVLRRGELPQWWPYDAGGSPLLATPPAEVFHPFTLLYAALDPLKGLVLQALLSTALAMFGAYALARRLGQSRPASLVAGVVFGANGYLVVLDEQAFMLTAAATMPWYALALLDAWRLGGARLVWPSAVFALQILAGDPQAAILSAAFGGALAVAWRPGRRSAVLAAVSPLVGAAMAAVQVWPALELIASTARAGRHWRENLSHWSLEGRHLIGMVVPIRHSPFEFVASTTVGLPVLALAAGGLVSLRRRAVIGVLVATVIVSLLLAVGPGGGLYELASAVVPLWTKFRYPVKNIEITMLAIALLAGEGLHQLSGPRRMDAFRLAALAGLIACVCGLGFAEPLELATWLSLLVALVALLWVRPVGGQGALVAGVLGAVLVSIACPLIPTADASIHDEPELVSVLRGLGVGLEGSAFDRLDDTRWPAAFQHVVRAAGVGGKGSLLAASWELPTISHYSLAASGRLLSLFGRATAGGIDPAGKRRIYGVFGARYLVLSPQLVRPDDVVIATERKIGFSVVENRGALPRAFAVPCARRTEDAIGEVVTGSFLPRREVLIETGDALECATRDDALVPAEVRRPANDAVDVTVSMPWSGYVVLNEAWFPGWRAYVDDVETPVLIANGAMRTVAVGAGAHTVRFRYVTPGLVGGALVSCVSVCAVIAFAWMMRRRRAAAG